MTERRQVNGVGVCIAYSWLVEEFALGNECAREPLSHSRGCSINTAQTAPASVLTHYARARTQSITRARAGQRLTNAVCYIRSNHMIIHATTNMKWLLSTLASRPGINYSRFFLILESGYKQDGCREYLKEIKQTTINTQLHATSHCASGCRWREEDATLVTSYRRAHTHAAQAHGWPDLNRRPLSALT